MITVQTSCSSYKTMLIVFGVSAFLLITVNGQLEEGEPCVTKNKTGICKLIHDCPYARDLLSKNEKPDHCSFTSFFPIVCCPETTKVLTNRLAPGNISLLYCDVQHAPTAGAQFAYGGTKASPRNYIHMALIGYGDFTNPEWRCGGSLVSNEFVLTAAHCVTIRDLPLSVVRLGELNWASSQDDATPYNFPILQIFVHPEYKPPQSYNDIALIKIQKIAQFTDYIGVACLAVVDPQPFQQPIATGWGKTSFTSSISNDLIEVKLKVVDVDECNKFYKNVSLRRLPNGLSKESQLCAGDIGKDTCKGDSGGPLQYGRPGRNRFYTVFGITSFGKACGITDTPGVYTRVPYYIEWLESIIWPNGPDFLPPEN